MENQNLPYEELRKFGIVNDENKFSAKLSKQDVDSFKKGGILIAEDSKNSLSFKIADNKLEVNVYNKDIVNHKDLASNEILEIANKQKNLYKVMADYGTITNKGEAYFNNNPLNEKTQFVELMNERGKTVFYGNDLADKLKNHNIGDNVQITTTAISKAELKTNVDGNESTINKYDNVFKVEDQTEKNKNFQSKIFEYDHKSKTILDVDTTNYDLKNVNGIEISKEKLEQLRKGKEIKLDDETTIQLSPKANNEKNLSSSAKNLLLVSLAFDGGLSFLIIKGIQKLQKMQEENQKQVDASKYQTELQKLKGFLQDKAEQYPDNKKIVSDLNIVGKELSAVQSKISNNTTVQEKSETNVHLKVADKDVFEDANTKKQLEKQEEIQEDKVQYKTMKR